MRINISIELRRPTRRAAGLVVAALLVLTPAVALAAHQFSDVPDSNIFHDDIAAITGLA
jgi:hypothetical protein